ncbi:MAG TPA: hypothetical protein PLK76_03735 [bacterium]|nr:hypothetical protein [bacterium]
MAENLIKINDFSQETRNKIVEILDIILYKLELFLATNDTENADYVEMPFFYKDQERLSLHDVQKVTEILEKHFGKLGFKFPLRGIDKTKTVASWKNLYNEIKNFRDSLKSKKPILSGDKIADILIVKPGTDSNNYLVIVNQKFNTPIKADRAKPSWELLFQIATDKEVAYSDNYKTSLDYFNSNKRCKLYTQTGLSLTKILQRESRNIVPAVRIGVITEKAYKQRIA